MDKVCHFELPYDDKDRAAKFYRDVFGWQIFDVPDMEYSFCVTTEIDAEMHPTEPGAINGGMYRRGPEAATSPVVVIQVESCEQRVRDVESAGGSVLVAPRPVGDMGIYAQVKDPEDNVIGLWQPLD